VVDLTDESIESGSIQRRKDVLQSLVFHDLLQLRETLFRRGGRIDGTFFFLFFLLLIVILFLAVIPFVLFFFVIRTAVLGICGGESKTHFHQLFIDSHHPCPAR
jgi:hypothetical protein